MLFSPLPHNFGISKRETNRSTKTARDKFPHADHAADLRLGRVLRLLTQHPTVVVSGTKIAEDLGSSRSDVWRMIQQLRASGVDVAGHPATGYQLKSIPDLLLPEIISPLLRGTIFDGRVHHFYKIGSTNTAAMAAAAKGAEEGSVFLAEEQTAGRGRGAHSWHSTPSAGIYCSIVLKPALPPSEVLVLALAAGIAVRAAIQQLDELLHIDLKWPNDVLIEGKKVCGILAEMNAEATRVRYVVVGIGINVNQSVFPQELRNQATSLKMITGREWSRVELLAALLKSLDHEYRLLLSDPDAHQSILRRFSEHSTWVRDKTVRVEENAAIIEGTTEGLDDRGFLLIRTAQGLHRVLSGSVRGI